MKKMLLAALATLAIQAPVHALIGFGVSGGINGTSISAKDDVISAGDLPTYFKPSTATLPSLALHREKMSSMNQLGLKAWLEIPLLPVEFEIGSNLAWGNYKSSLVYNDGISAPVTIPVDIPSPLVGFGESKGSTPYVNLLTDATIRYPFLQIPPGLTMLKIYVGAGVTHVMATRVIDRKDLTKTFASATGSFDPAKPDAATGIVKDNILQSTFGGHLSVGAQFKIPVIPIALFVDGKWYLNTAVSDAATKYPLVLSAGAGFAL